jgi:hypothetical protein
MELNLGELFVAILLNINCNKPFLFVSVTRENNRSVIKSNDIIKCSAFASKAMIQKFIVNLEAACGIRYCYGLRYSIIK